MTQLRNANPQESRGYLSNEFLQYVIRHYIQRRTCRDVEKKCRDYYREHLSKMTLRGDDN